MSDRTNAKFYVYLATEPTEAQVETAAKIMNDYGINYDAEKDEAAGENEGQWLISVGANEVVCGGIDNYIVPALEEAFPDYIEIFAWEDPAYEWLGSLTRLRKGQPDFHAECDADANVVLTAPKIKELLKDPDPVTAILRALGETAVCRFCGREIIFDYDDGRWIDPEAAGDDRIWREVCGSHDTFQAPHEPERGAE